MKKNPYIKIAGRKIGPDYEPFIIAEVGINHEGSLTKAKKMVTDAKTAGADCVKFQSHVVEDEMVPAAKKTIPGNAKVSIWEIMERCALTEKEEYELKKYTESLGLIYLCTPFSRTAADRLEKMKVSAYKIGSGECNNYPLIEHIASFGMTYRRLEKQFKFLKNITPPLPSSTPLQFILPLTIWSDWEP